MTRAASEAGMHASEDDFSDSEAFVADEEGVLADGDQVVAEYGESDGACRECSCLCARRLLGVKNCLCFHSML